jgi:hypothetical protein
MMLPHGYPSRTNAHSHVTESPVETAQNASKAQSLEYGKECREARVFAPPPPAKSEAHRRTNRRLSAASRSPITLRLPCGIWSVRLHSHCVLRFLQPDHDRTWEKPVNNASNHADSRTYSVIRTPCQLGYMVAGQVDWRSS